MKHWIKNNPSDKIWWQYDDESVGELVVSFDKEHTFNLWKDYPWKFTVEQQELFDSENPYWANFFADRKRLGNG